jgi:hypothetical protein
MLKYVRAIGTLPARPYRVFDEVADRNQHGPLSLCSSPNVLWIPSLRARHCAPALLLVWIAGGAAAHLYRGPGGRCWRSAFCAMSCMGTAPIWRR